MIPQTQQRNNVATTVSMLRVHQLVERFRPPTIQEQKEFVPTAIKMLTLIATLDMVMYDLEEEFTESGLFRHQVKRRFRQAQAIVAGVHDEAYRMLGMVSNSGVLTKEPAKEATTCQREYNDEMDQSYNKIQAAVLLKAPERAYSITRAIIRLIIEANSLIRVKYQFDPVSRLNNALTLLEVPTIVDRNVDTIINLNLKK